MTTPDRTSVKTVGMIVRGPTGRIGIVIKTQYAGGTRLCRVMFAKGDPMFEQLPGDDLIPATAAAAHAAGYEPMRTNGKAVRRDW